jgi:hypothetical protein
MARMNWEGAAKRDRARRQGSIPAFLDVGKPSRRKKKRRKTKTANAQVGTSPPLNRSKVRRRNSATAAAAKRQRSQKAKAGTARVKDPIRVSATHIPLDVKVSAAGVTVSWKPLRRIDKWTVELRSATGERSRRQVPGAETSLGALVDWKAGPFSVAVAGLTAGVTVARGGVREIDRSGASLQKPAPATPTSGRSRPKPPKRPRAQGPRKKKKQRKGSAPKPPSSPPSGRPRVRLWTGR